MDSASSDSVTPGETVAHTACLVALWTAAVGETWWAPIEATLMKFPWRWVSP